jgi:hypothetical protein
MVQQSLKGNRIVLGGRLTKNAIQTYLNTLSGLLIQGGPPRLFEFIVIDNSILFVDAKPYPWSVSFADQFVPGDAPHWLYESPTRTEAVLSYSGSFDLANLPLIDESTVIHVGSHAVLAHFVTYSLRRGIAGIVT